MMKLNFMVKEPEENAEADKKRKEEVETVTKQIN